MNLPADESVDKQIVERLRRDGHTVSSVPELEAGISDETVIEKAERDQAI